MIAYPKVKTVVASEDKCLIVTFDNGIHKLYDCTPLLEIEVFRPLKNDWFFKLARADANGYGISWNEEIDLSESELWENGLLI